MQPTSFLPVHSTGSVVKWQRAFIQTVGAMLWWYRWIFSQHAEVLINR